MTQPTCWKGDEIWGLTACDGPFDGTMTIDGKERTFHSYTARGVTKGDIRDDGTGLGDTTRRSGLANLRHRAEHHGGDLTVDSDPDGTRLTWSVPVG